MVAKLSPELVHEIEQAGNQPLPVEDPTTKRIYVLVDAQQFDVVRRESRVGEGWTESKSERRHALIRKKFSEGIDADESRELAELQNELSAYRKRTVPLPYDVVDALQTALNSSVAPVS